MKLFATFIILLIFFSEESLPAGQEDNFGRLFSRPNERSNLDYLRQNQKLKIITPQETLQADATAKGMSSDLPDPIMLQGYVKRNDGKKNTVWINKKAVLEDSIVDNVNIGRLSQNNRKNNNGITDSLDLKVFANGKHIRLKAGQVYEPETNQVKEIRVAEKEKRIEAGMTGLIDGDEKSQY